MKILNSLNFTNEKKRFEEKKNFNEILNEIIDDTIFKKKSLHDKYYSIIQKLWLSNRSSSNKTILAKYILGRLTRESERLFLKASNLASRMCPCCANKQYQNKHKISERIH